MKVRFEAELVMAAEGFVLRKVQNESSGECWAQWDLEKPGFTAHGLFTGHALSTQFWVSIARGTLTALSDGMFIAIRKKCFLLVHRSLCGLTHVIRLSEQETNSLFSALENVYLHCR